MSKIRILIADDHSLMRIGLKSLFASERAFEIVGEAENGREAVDLAAQLKPDVVIMDLLMPQLSGAEATRLICAADPSVHVLVLTTYADAAELTDAVRNGATGVLMKDVPPDTMIASIKTVAAGGEVLSNRVRQRLRETEGASPLTPRQTEILASVARGLTNGDIARQLNISEIGVKKHLQVIFAKLGVGTRAEAAAIALKRQLCTA